MTFGVLQGSILGPVLFLVYINDNPDYIFTNSTVALFMDDSKLYRAINHPGTDKLLQWDLNCLHNCGQDWQMDFNGTKCKVLQISRKKTPTTSNGSYTWDGHQLECVSSIIDLSVTITSDLSWSRHNEVTVAKPIRLLASLKEFVMTFRMQV